MKKLLYSIIALLMLSATIFAQAPQSFKYQAVARDVLGELIANHEVSFQISILQGSESGTAVYTETHVDSTNQFGLVSLEIGTGTTTDDFTGIDWSNDAYFIQVEMDASGGASYTLMGTSQLLSVPYALHARTVENVNIPIYTTAEIVALMPENGQALYNSTDGLYQIYNGSSWVSFNALCWPQPTTANAGSDQPFTDGTTSTSLAANTPATGHGTGEWSIISGTGGSFTDTADPNTSFTGQLHESYTLRWSISTNCSTSEDEVTIGFWQQSVTDIDGNNYYAVYIGDQLWMAENLKTTKYNDGTTIPLVSDKTEWSNLATDAYCWYDDNEATYRATYGALYNWYTVNTGKLCPTGWHMPSDTEWKELEMHLGMSQSEVDDEGFRGTNEGSKLAGNASLWNDGDLDSNAEFGTSAFKAIPGGLRSSTGMFNSLGEDAHFWSATESTSSLAWHRFLYWYYSTIERYACSKDVGISVRCIKDE